MAFVIMGGLVVSTFLTVILLPVTASLSEDMFAWFGRLPGHAVRFVTSRLRRTESA
jgi:hypothetical protein